MATLPCKLCSKRWIGARRRILEHVRDLAVDQRVDAADEKACHARHAAQITPALREILQPGDVRLRHFLIHAPARKEASR